VLLCALRRFHTCGSTGESKVPGDYRKDVHLCCFGPCIRAGNSSWCWIRKGTKGTVSQLAVPMRTICSSGKRETLTEQEVDQEWE
jgi:hypothetical protein